MRDDAAQNNITRETYDEFCDRVRNTILNYDVDVIDRTIETMPKRIKLILKGKGYRTKYWEYANM